MSLWYNNSRVQSVLGVSLAITLVGCLSGCSKMGMHHNMGQSQVREQATNVNAQKAINTIGEVSQNVYDDVKGQNWQGAADKLNTLKQANEELKSSHLAKGSDQYVDRLSNDLGKQIDKKNQVSAMESANELTRAAMDLGEPPKPELSKELSLLDYYGRELEIGAIAKDKNKLSGTAKNIKQTWFSLKPKVEAQSGAKKGTGEEARMDQLVKQLDKANTTQEYQQLANQILDQSDKLGGKFSKS